MQFRSKSLEWSLTIEVQLAASIDLAYIFFCYEGSVELEKLRQAVMGQNGRNLDDLEQMDGIIYGLPLVHNFKVKKILEFVHTSDLESVNSLILKYTSKRYSYR